MARREALLRLRKSLVDRRNELIRRLGGELKGLLHRSGDTGDSADQAFESSGEEVSSQLAQGDAIVLNLNDPDFTTATRLVASVNKGMGDDIASVIDGGSVRVRAPLDITQRVSFLSSVENLQVEPGMASAKVIINSRTGTVVISSNVIVTPAAVSHGSLSVTIKEEQRVSQPAPFSPLGQTTVVNNSTIKVDQGSNRMFLFKPGVELEQIVRAVNDVGAAPGDLVAILEALREAGALQAELIVI